MKSMLVSLRVLLAFTLMTGVLYPLGITAVGLAFFKKEATGSLAVIDGKVVGSELIAQGFTQDRYFWPRPSTAKYDAANSGASNQGLTSAALIQDIQKRENEGAVADMRFSSGSGLDPHISGQAARSQVERIVKARHLTGEKTQKLATLLVASIEGRQLRIFGEERVNVLKLNMKLDQEFGQ